MGCRTLSVTSGSKIKNKKIPHMTSIWYALMWKIVLLLQSEPYLCVYLLSFLFGNLYKITNCLLKYLTLPTNTVMKSGQQSLDFIFILSIHLVSFFPKAVFTKQSLCIPKCRQHKLKIRPYMSCCRTSLCSEERIVKQQTHWNLYLCKVLMICFIKDF